VAVVVGRLVATTLQTEPLDGKSNRAGRAVEFGVG
jgi:hypothetical protein